MHLIVKIEEHLIRDSKMLPDQEYNQIVAFWFREPIFRHASLASAVWIRRWREREREEGVKPEFRGNYRLVCGFTGLVSLG